MTTQDRLPTGEGSSTGFTSSAGGNKWLDVDDPVGTPNDDTDYNYIAGGDGAQHYTFTAFAIDSSAMEKVSVFTRSKMAAGTGNLTARLRVGGSTYTGSYQNIGSTYEDNTYDWLTNPKTSESWLEADAEGAGANPLQQFGVLTAGVAAGEQLNLTQIYATVTYTAAGGGTLPLKHPFLRPFSGPLGRF